MARRRYLASILASIVVFGSTGAAVGASATTTQDPTTFATVIGDHAAAKSTFATEIAASGLLAPSATRSPLDSAICYVNQDDPHFSSGANGVIAKTRLICEIGRSITYSLAMATLWTCSFQVPANTSANTAAAKYGCDEAAYENYTNIPVAQGKTVTRYVPNTGKPGVKGTAYYFAATGYRVSGNSTEYYTTMNSVSPYIHG